MKVFELQQALTQIDDCFLEEAEVYQFNQRGKNIHTMKMFAAAAACVALLGAMGLEYQKHIEEIKNPVGEVDNALIITYVAVDKYVAAYEQVRVNEDIDLSKWKGEVFSTSENVVWYKVKNSENIKNLIRESEDKELTLWEFESFYAREIEEMRRAFPSAVFEPYSYADVLKLIYNVTDAKQISCIEIRPSINDNTEVGKAYQKTIGTSYIKDRDSIEFLYKVICQMNRYGTDDELDPLYSFGYRSEEIQRQIEENWHMRWVFCRNLTIVLEDGTTIDRLKYTAVSGRFYEFCSINYDALDDETVKEVNRLLLEKREAY